MNWTTLLLADPSACLRLRVLRELLHRPADDGEVRELIDLRARDPLLVGLLESQQSNAWW